MSEPRLARIYGLTGLPEQMVKPIHNALPNVGYTYLPEQMIKPIHNALQNVGYTYLLKFNPENPLIGKIGVQTIG